MYGDYNIVQMHMYAFLKATQCPNAPYQLANFYEPGTTVPRAGNVFKQLAANIFPAAGPFNMSSFDLLPVGSMQTSIGYEIVVCFVNRGSSFGTSSAGLYARLYSPGAIASCRYPAVFPARASFD